MSLWVMAFMSMAGKLALPLGTLTEEAGQDLRVRPPPMAAALWLAILFLHLQSGLHLHPRVAVLSASCAVVDMEVDRAGRSRSLAGRCRPPAPPPLHMPSRSHPCHVSR